MYKYLYFFSNFLTKLFKFENFSFYLYFNYLVFDYPTIIFFQIFKASPYQIGKKFSKLQVFDFVKSIWKNKHLHFLLSTQLVWFTFFTLLLYIDIWIEDRTS